MGNVVSEFRNFDKDNSGALSIDELKRAFDKLGVSLTHAVWSDVVYTIDDNATGELEYEELLDAMKRFQRGGWDAVVRKYVRKRSPEEEARAEKCFNAAMDKIRDAAYSKDK